MDALSHYCTSWQMTVNLSKTKVVVFNKGGRVETPNLTYMDKVVESVREYEYLGCILNVSGSPTRAIDERIMKAGRALFALRHYIEGVELPVRTRCKLVVSLVTPVLLYTQPKYGVWQHYVKTTELRISTAK